MKKTFYIISSLATLLSLPVLLFSIRVALIYSPGKSFTHILSYYGVLILIILVPVLSLLIGFLIDRKGRNSKAYRLTFIIINIILLLMFAFYLLMIFNFESV